MDNTDWKIISVLYEKPSINKAADALYMTQSALTKRIQNMETEWGVRLVERSRSGIRFTPEGRYLAEYSLDMLNALETIENHFSDVENQQKILRFGVPNSVARNHLPSLLRIYKEQYDALQIHLTVTSSDHLVRLLSEGTIDMGILCGDYPYVGERTCLFKEDLYLVGSKDRSADELIDMPVIRSYLNPLVKLSVDQWWKNHFGRRLREAYTVPDADIAIRMAENGLGVTFLFGDSWNMDQDKLQLIPVMDKNGEPVSRKVWLAYPESCYDHPDYMDFISMFEEYYQVN